MQQDPLNLNVSASDSTARVLLVEDDEDHALLVARAFEGEASLTLERVATLAQAREALAGSAFHLVLADLMLPDGRGLDLLSEDGGAAPVVIITSQGDERSAVEALKRGAVDYVPKTPQALGDAPRLCRAALRQWTEQSLRRAAEAALRDANEVLEARVAERTRELETANRVKAQFLSNMSHELRTPLTGILGVAELLQDTTLSQEQREYLDLIEQAARQLNANVDNLLELSAVEFDAPVIAAKPFHPRPLLESMALAASVKASSKQLAFRYDLAADIPPVLVGDALRIRQALLQLLLNAVAFTPQGGVTMRAHVEPAHGEATVRPGAAALFVVAVEDTGVGVPSDKLEAIFENFTLGEDYMVKAHGGAGVGLSIARKLARLMGGEVLAHSVVNQGSVFTLSAQVSVPETADETPRHVEDEQAVRNPAAARLTGCAEAPTSILVVEDDAVIRRALRRALVSHGYVTQGVPNGRDALRKLATDRFDCVLMDLQMPVMDGLEATRRIRSGEDPRIDARIPIIAISAFAQTQERTQLLAHGLDELAFKPLQGRALLELIRDVLERRRHTPPGAGGDLG